MATTKLKNYLNRNEVEYRLIPHPRAFTAQEIAANSHITGHEIAKTVIVKIDGALAMAVLPASEVIDLEQFAALLGATLVELAYESEFERFFNDCEVGAMPPFGNLFGMKVFVDSELALDEQIAFSAGNHAELIQLNYTDFEELVQPIMLEFGVCA
ncbi:MAG: YbaK/EbsC family protein [Opitutales bacterium]|jgi:Ala-tRNA(Pro) deacylase|nr:YbaK/EbsC family protein [Opitutales bacterium]MBT6768571.1 YbaK/EbsC family protein [Opitutales bacterium]MDG2253742.1 YbaK/EbsC family protein [Opitutaceae bacterium]